MPIFTPHPFPMGNTRIPDNSRRQSCHHYYITSISANDNLHKEGSDALIFKKTYECTLIYLQKLSNEQMKWERVFAWNGFRTWFRSSSKPFCWKNFSKVKIQHTMLNAYLLTLLPVLSVISILFYHQSKMTLMHNEKYKIKKTVYSAMIIGEGSHEKPILVIWQRHPLG